ncbi:uncharacterized protein L203_104299 [Cryptococcus depauperatus CBS 7841]|uniref:Uncharacterized protein n=1 Tax=Cryptococcus depauperatus CBS 7841 TaxID=1295531 RepID=A0A1E3I7T7_9TREE|nr:hypothetical protein L203_05306 [Cryptococcus depauperatus CBS 7841]
MASFNKEEGDIVAKFIERLIAEQSSYVGICQPGDFKSPAYRVILPNPSDPRLGRGYHSCWEEVLLETEDRKDIDGLFGIIKGLTSKPGGPLAVRHILNPSQNKDEGLRLIWPKDGQMGEDEMGDWPRRDQMIREGKTVKAPDDNPEFIPFHGFPAMNLASIPSSYPMLPPPAPFEPYGIHAGSIQDGWFFVRGGRLDIEMSE